MPTMELYESGLIRLGPSHFLDMTQRTREGLTIVRVRVIASAFPPALEDRAMAGDRLIIHFRGSIYNISITNLTFTSTPVTGSRQRDGFGNVQTQILRQEEYFDIEGVLDREEDTLYTQNESESSAAPEEYRNPQIGRSPLEAPPGDMPTTLVICKWCTNQFTYKGRLDHNYYIDPLDRPGLVTCRSCYNSGLVDTERLGPDEREWVKPEPEPKKRKNLYSRKLRIRRKE